MSQKKIDEQLSNLSASEKRAILKGLSGKAEVKTFKHHFGKKCVKFGYCSDLHIGSKYFSYELWSRMCAYFKREGIEVVYCPGDLTEGMSGRGGHIYELLHIGATAQINESVRLISQAPFQMFSILGNHDLWFKQKADIGLDVGKEIEAKCSNFICLGEWEANVEIFPGVVMKLFHGNDGTAYADSYKLQKLIESFTGGEKPNIVLSGHYHKALSIFRRNVFGFECGTICGQTGWMRGKKIQAHLGFGIIEVWKNGHGIQRLRHEFFPFYEEEL